MGLSDIFGSGNPQLPSVPPPAAANHDLLSKASDAVTAFDKLSSAKHEYNLKRAARLKEVDQELSALKQRVDDAQTTYERASGDLKTAMEDVGVEKVPMADRAPVEIKTRKGGKRDITLRWLKEELGPDEAKDLWGKVPRYDDRRDVVIKPPYDDQPSD